MGFVISYSGSTEETLAHLRGLTPADLGNDRAGIVMRDIIAQAISECSANLESHQVYNVRASGESGTTQGFKLEATVGLGDRMNYQEPIPSPLSL